MPVGQQQQHKTVLKRWGCTHRELPLVVLNQEGRVGLGIVVVAGGVHAGHEVVVEVVVAAHADGEDAPVQVPKQRRPVAPEHPRHLLRRRPEVLHLLHHREVVALHLLDETHNCCRSRPGCQRRRTQSSILAVSPSLESLHAAGCSPGSPGAELQWFKQTLAPAPRRIDLVLRPRGAQPRATF
ncbi:hypothetical protein Taro_043994 [Colocasia esculenta]|uniref:Uncharacterized protein n=1 Tax=Colocasia esculenta TaxID=4460 RepID=A0A843WST5_COLES|nr:hypothetical protein [Colocasia esculenta]